MTPSFAQDAPNQSADSTEYRFTTQVEADTPGSTTTYLYAARDYDSPAAIPSVSQIDFNLKSLLEDLVSLTVHDRETGDALKTNGVTITTIFKHQPTGHLKPVGLLFDGVTPSQHGVSAGVWRLPDTLIHAINQRFNGITTTEVPYGTT